MRLILFVHGALSTRRSFNYIKGQLFCSPDSQPDDMLRDFSYDIRKSPADDLVKVLVSTVRTAVKNSKLSKVVFVCHSFGGVIAVAAVRALYEEGCPVSCRVISMSSPYGGSSVAGVALILRPSSQFLKNTSAYNGFMRGFREKPLPCPVKGLITTAGSVDFLSEANDSVVTLESQLHFRKDPLWSSVKVKYNHFEVLLNPETVEHIQKELKRG